MSPQPASPTLRLLISKTLGDQYTRSIDFTIRKFTIRASEYRAIRFLMLHGAIQVVSLESDVMERDGAGTAFYQSTPLEGHENTLFVPDTFGKSVGSEPFLTLDEASVVVHEATHAILDLRERPMTKLDSEMLAYFTQCWYGYKKGGGSGSEGKLGTMERIKETGYAAVAHYVDSSKRNSPYPDDQEEYRLGLEKRIDELREAIEAIPMYRDARNTIVRYNGISWASSPPLALTLLGGGGEDSRMEDDFRLPGLQDPW